MLRPALLIAEKEPENAISIRKLVLETAKYNVITAYSAPEALEAYRTFPKVAITVITANLGTENDCARTWARSSGRRSRSARTASSSRGTARPE